MMGMTETTQPFTATMKPGAFRRALSNVLYFLDTDVFPVIRFFCSGDGILEIAGADNFAAAVGTCEITSPKAFSFQISSDAEGVRDFAGRIKDLVKTPGYIDVEITPGEFFVKFVDRATGENLTVSLTVYHTDVFAAIDSLFDSAGSLPAVAMDNFGLMPDRLCKFTTRLSPDVKGSALYCRVTDNPSKPGKVLFVKYGTEFRAAIAGTDLEQNQKYVSSLIGEEKARTMLWLAS
jgi:hypothetical protein